MATVTWYLHARGVRQLAWFKASGERLEKQTEKKNRRLITVYFISIALALGKTFVLAAAITNWEIMYSILTFSLLIMIGISSSTTAIYVNKNERSLRHRYAQQERAIQFWINSVKAEAGEPPSQETPTAKQGVALASLMKFEDIMNEELIDWIRITMHDSVELSVA